MDIEPCKPRFTVVIDDEVGDLVTLTESPDGELIYTMPASVVQDDSPARFAAHTVLQKAVEVAILRFQALEAESAH